MVRHKARYVLGELRVKSDAGKGQTLDAQQIFVALRAALTSNYGPMGAATVGKSLAVKYYNPATSLLLLRSGRAVVDMVCQSLVSIANIKGKKIEIEHIYTGGSLRACQKAALSFNRKLLHRSLEASKPASKSSNRETT